MREPRDIVDISWLRERDQAQQAQDQTVGTTAGAQGRPWLAIHWKCCSVYSRVYRNREATAYTGSCPRCGLPLRVAVGPGGTSERFFTAQ